MHRVSDLRQRDVININDGKRLGLVSDVDVDPDTGRIIALIVPGPGKFLGIFGGANDYIIKWHRIVRIGPDVILVDWSDGDHRGGPPGDSMGPGFPPGFNPMGAGLPPGMGMGMGGPGPIGGGPVGGQGPGGTIVISGPASQGHGHGGGGPGPQMMGGSGPGNAPPDVEPDQERRRRRR